VRPAAVSSLPGVGSPAPSDWPVEPLRERIPIYLVVFGVGLAAGGIVGLIVWAAADMRLGSAMGYTFIGLGTLFLLVGGARGGGYSNLGIGAIEALVGGRNRSTDDYTDDVGLRRGEVMKRRDPMDRLRRGLRPQANPAAFWQSIGGFLYLGLGALLTLLAA
jgi:hypothetical protein